MFIICWILPYLLYPHPNPDALGFFLTGKAASPATENAPMQAHKWETNHLHACAQLDKHWPSTLHWVREGWWFRSAWWSLSWKCEGDKIKIAIRRVGIKHGERSEWERVKRRRVRRETGRAWSRGAEDWGEFIQQPGDGSVLTDAALEHLNWLTYRLGRGWDVLDHHLPFRAQVLLAQRRFAFLVQVHVLLETQARRTFHLRQRSCLNGKFVSELFLFGNSRPYLDIKQKQMRYTIKRTHFQFIPREKGRNCFNKIRLINSFHTIYSNMSLHGSLFT